MNKTEFFCFPRYSGKKFVYEISIKLAKQLEMDFAILKPNCVKEYKKGKLVKVINNGQRI